MALVLVAIFCASRVVYERLGVRFIDGFTASWQALDPLLLKQDLLRSLWFLHVQPPAFNFLVGTIQSIAPTQTTVVYRALLLICGLTLYLALVRVMLFLSVPRGLALVASSLFIVSPAAILYENWFFYTLPVATLLLLSALALAKFATARTTIHAFVFFALVGLLCCMQSSFHLVYFACVLGAVLLAYPTERKRVLAASAFPALTVLGLYVKNAVLFGTFSVSSWMGMNLARVPFPNWPIEERRQLVQVGKLSPVALVEPFSRLELYPAADQRLDDAREKLPLLDNPSKSTGEPNYNHLAYLKISSQYMKDVEYSLRYFPRFYAKGVLRSAFVYTKAASDYAWLVENRKVIRGIDEFYDRVFLGRVLLGGEGLHVRGAAAEPLHLYLALIVGLPLVVLVAARRTLRLRRSPHAPDRAQAFLLFYLCFSVTYVAAVGILLESGENNRFRFMTDPMSLVLLAVALHELQSALSKRRARLNSAIRA